MGNIVQCLIANSNRSRFEPRVILNLTNTKPINIAFDIINSSNHYESITMSIVLSNSVETITNTDHSETGLQLLLEYLQSDLTISLSHSGSIASLIIKEASLPSRSFLRQVSKILLLRDLNDKLEECMGMSENINVISRGDKSDKVKVKLHSKTSQSDKQSVNKCDAKIEDLVGDRLIRAHNACLIIDCLATRFCGPNSQFLLNDDMINFLTTCCKLSEYSFGIAVETNVWIVVLRAILCFEKFGLTRDCKERICCYFEERKLPIPFCNLESLCNSTDNVKRQVGFCSQWLLDNTYNIPGRTFTYQQIDRTNLNAVMNIRDASQYIKLSPIGLEVRCDADSFESVRCTFEVKSGTYYYEAKLITSGVMQIGWATKRSEYMNYDGHGIGDDLYSVAYDGCRQVIWYNANPQNERVLPKWKPGDILGCLINIKKKYILFSINGKVSKKHTCIFNEASTGFYAGGSFFNNQQCLFNFGREPFQYPPAKSIPYASFNENGKLTEEEQIVLPRSIQLAQQLEMADASEGSLARVNNKLCSICYSLPAQVTLEPCKHSDFCQKCVTKVNYCPLCRCGIKSLRRHSSLKMDNFAEEF